MDPFRILLADVAKGIGDKDLEVLKYFSEDLLTGSEIDKINSPTDLFEKLLQQRGEKGCKAFLHNVFSLKKDYELRNMLGTGAEDGQPQGNPLRQFRILLYEINEELSEEEWERFKFLLPADKITKRDKEKTRIAILSLLVKRLGESSCFDCLKEYLTSLRRLDLLKKLNQYKYERRTPTVNPEEHSSILPIEESTSRNLHAEECGYEQSSNNNNINNRSIQDVDENPSVFSSHSTNESGNAISDNKGLDETSESGATLKVQPNQQPSSSEQSIDIIHLGSFSYDPHHRIGRSKFSDTYKGYKPNIDIEVAVKVISEIPEDDFIHNSIFECDILKHLEVAGVEQNFIKYYGYETRGNTFYLGLEFYRCTLMEYMYMKEYSLEKEVAKKNCRSLAEGVEFLHSRDIIHRGINPYNIFVFEKERKEGKKTLFKIGNVGFCERIDSRQQGLEDMCSFDYIAKEVLEEYNVAKNVNYLGQLKFSAETDIFALGCVFYFIFTKGQHPYRRENLLQFDRILKGCDPVLDELIESKDFHFGALIKPMISHKRKDRPTAASVCIHPALKADDHILEFYSKVSDKLSRKIPKEETNKEELERKKQQERRKFEDRSILPENNGNWLENIPVPELRKILEDKKHDGTKVESLLRAIRNTTSHLYDWPSDVLDSIKGFEGGLLAIWNETCPKLFEHVYQVFKRIGWDETEEFEFMKFK